MQKCSGFGSGVRNPARSSVSVGPKRYVGIVLEIDKVLFRLKNVINSCANRALPISRKYISGLYYVNVS